MKLQQQQQKSRESARLDSWLPCSHLEWGIDFFELQFLTRDSKTRPRHCPYSFCLPVVGGDCLLRCDFSPSSIPWLLLHSVFQYLSFSSASLTQHSRCIKIFPVGRDEMQPYIKKFHQPSDGKVQRFAGVFPVFFFSFFFFVGKHLQHMEVPGLGVESGWQLPAYTTAMTTPDLSHIYDLCCSLWQC